MERASGAPEVPVQNEREDQQRNARPPYFIFEVGGERPAYIFQLPTFNRAAELQRQQEAPAQNFDQQGAQQEVQPLVPGNLRLDAQPQVVQPRQLDIPQGLQQGQIPTNMAEALGVLNDDDDDSTEHTGEQNQPALQQQDLRSMIVAVRYSYRHHPNPQNPDDDNLREGQISFNIPNVPPNRTEYQMSILIELAASIALGAVYAFSSEEQGTPREVFEAFKVTEVDVAGDTTCPICFDEYLTPPASTSKDESKPSAKRPRDDDEEDEDDVERNTRPKRVHLSEESGESSGLDQDLGSSSATSQSSASGQEQLEDTAKEEPKKENESLPVYLHEPVELPCGHVFGRTCVHAWLKTKTTCPLCRFVVHTNPLATMPPPMINLPEMNEFLNPLNSDRPLVIFLDRDTNTLLTRRSEPGTALANTNTVIPTTLFRPVLENDFSGTRVAPGTPRSGIPSSIAPSEASDATRDPYTASLLRELEVHNQATEDAFPSGVMSRRTRNGVETMNLGSDSQTMVLGESGGSRSRPRNSVSRSILGARRALLQRRLQLNTAGGDTVLRLNDDGVVERADINGEEGSQGDADDEGEGETGS